eukprot:CAMPEP_0113534294 /NCGR_PEP_ID=MMETSP0015_2-20120614/5084_1 /TAXON_ID=2838 /ORGANISM="Odontella" /LENGTH=298 /DNA_ID=CAMNT_0000433449 /DNA_START=148 /DNA_END=1044 /DNA_ORIENTATION=+ /assembly_acc=CAM_ASM_000160
MSSDSEDSSSGEDVPLAALGGKHLRPPGINSDESSSSEDEAEFDENAEEEEEPSSEEENDDDDFIAEDSEEEEEVEGDEEESESDSDDDVPLASLKSPKGKKAAAGKKQAKKPAAKKKTAAKPKKKAAAKTKKAAAAEKKKQAPASSSSGEPTTASGHLYAKSEKGKLIQAVLCRWWYVVTWPDPLNLPALPRHYDALDGFPGVYVCTSGDDVGKIIDHRDPSTCPSFANFAKKGSEELVEMLMEAITKQKEQLIAAEGEDTDTEGDLDELELWARRLNTTKADKQAEKVLKAAKIVI